MKNYTVKVLLPAYLDMADALATLKEYSEDAPVRFSDRLLKRFDQLEQTPEMYAVYDDFPVYRMMMLMGFLVFYTVDHEQQVVDVHRIVWNKRKITADLLESKE